MPTTLTKPTYRTLLKEVRKTIARGRRRAQEAVEREKVRTAWETGKLILEHVLLYKERAEYGARVIRRLARDLRVSQTELNYMVEFAREYEIGRTSGQLSWSHYQALLGINDKPKRDGIAERAGAGDWSVKRLREEVRRVKGGKQGRGSFTSLRMTKRGKPGVYKVMKAASGIHQGKLVYDLGFANYFRPNSAGEQRLLRSFAARNDNASDFYHYEAWVTEVVDGDTFWADIHLGFGVTTDQRLRFRNINARELPSAAGERAKKYLSRKIRGKKVLIKTSKSDQYGRYLVDVWLGKTYINQLMAEKGHAFFI